MILLWMAYATVCAALVAAAGTFIERASASRGIARRWTWLAAIAISAVAPILTPLIRGAHAVERTVEATTAVVATAPAPSGARLDVFTLGAWAGCSLLFGALLIVGDVRNRRMLARCRRATVAGHDAFISRDFGPALVGALVPRIVVPEWTLALDSNEQMLIVAHEMQHASARDPLLATVGAGVLVLMPWNIALWWQLSRLRLAIELDCDRRVVVGQDDDVIPYSQLLLHVREQVQSTQRGVLALSHARSSLAKRLDALLRRHHARVAHAGGLAACGAMLLTALGFIPAPRVDVAIAALRAAPATPLASSIEPPTFAAPDSQVAAIVVTPTPAAAAGARRVRSPKRAAPQDARAEAIAAAPLPPVSVVPSNALAGITATASTLPPRRIVGGRGGGAGGFMAVGGGGRVGGGSAAVNTVSPADGTPRAAMSPAGSAGTGAAAAGGRVGIIRATARPVPPDTLNPRPR